MICGPKTVVVVKQTHLTYKYILFVKESYKKNWVSAFSLRDVPCLSP